MYVRSDTMLRVGLLDIRHENVRIRLIRTQTIHSTSWPARDPANPQSACRRRSVPIIIAFTNIVTIIWDPHTASNIHKLEMVQRRTARHIMHNYNRHASVTKPGNIKTRVYGIVSEASPCATLRITASIQNLSRCANNTATVRFF